MWVVAMIVLIVAAGAVLVRWTRWHPLAVAAMLGGAAAVVIAVAMVLSVSARAEAVLITGTGTFALVAALAVVGALAGALCAAARCARCSAERPTAAPSRGMPDA